MSNINFRVAAVVSALAVVPHEELFQVTLCAAALELVAVLPLIFRK